MFNLKKSVIFIVSFTFFCLYSHALPGITNYLPDYSGDYVYYKDATFDKDVYIGILYYNESTYAIRYYSDSRDITLYLSTDTTKDTLEFTGETITGSSSNDDVDTINYLHNIMYDFYNVRKTAVIENTQNQKLSCALKDFGGQVTITFNANIPVFNIDSITSPDGKELFKVQTSGLLTSNADDSFLSYKGIEGLPKDKKRDFKKKKAQPLNAVFEGQSVTLDDKWQSSMENLWFLGDYALLTLNKVQVPPEYKENTALFKALLIRKLSQSTTQSYALWPRMEINDSEQSTYIKNIFYQPLSQNVTRDFKILTYLKDGSFAYFTLTVFDDVYLNNKKYFNAIIQSYTAQ